MRKKIRIQEYKRESFEMFTQMLESIKYELIATLSKFELAPEQQWAETKPMTPELHYYHAEFNGVLGNEGVAQQSEPSEESVAVAEREERPQTQTIRTGKK